MIYQKEKIAERLKDERTAKGLTQQELAVRLKYSKPTIIEWERGNGQNRIPNMDTLLELCDLYNCEVGYLLCEYDTKFRRNATIQEETGLSEEAIEALRKMNKSIPPLFNLAFKENPDRMKRMYAPRFIIALLSFLLTDGVDKLNMVAERLVSSNTERIVFNAHSDIEKAILKNAYKNATDGMNLEDPYGHNFTDAEDRFRGYIWSQFLDNDELCESIKNESPMTIISIDDHSNPDDIHYGEEPTVNYLKDAPNEYIAEELPLILEGLFYTMFEISQEKRMMTDFLNSTNLYEAVKDFNETLME